VGTTGLVLARVAYTHSVSSSELIDVTLAGEFGASALSATPDHPFWVAEVGDFVVLGEVEPGMVLRTSDEEGARVLSMERRLARDVVFNFEVHGVHNYFVRSERESAGILVHNCNIADGSGMGTAIDLDAPGIRVSDRPPAGMTGPTAGKPVDANTRQRILSRDQNANGTWDCATCGKNTSNPSNVHTGHVEARSHGGDLSDGNLRCEGAQCNLSQGNRDAPTTTCAEAGSCGAPYGRTD
jgi:hypothetical protein